MKTILTKLEKTEMCNKVLRNAIKSFVGLDNRELSTVFDIRKDLKEKIKINLLIEDVSVLSVLDSEIVQCVLPRGDQSLCEIICYWDDKTRFERLAQNEQERITETLTFSDNALGNEWFNDINYLNKFAARYLNSIRLNDEEISNISQERKFGKDITHSHCQNCDFKKKCFEIFGFAEFEKDIKVGLFPFNKVSFNKMIGSLIEKGSIEKLKEVFGKYHKSLNETILFSIRAIKL